MRVIPVAMRRWRRSLAQCAAWTEIGALRRTLQSQAYDAVIDTQGRCAVYTGKRVIERNFDKNDPVHFGGYAGHVAGMQGEYGTGPGQFIYPVAIVQDDSAHIYVAEYGENDRVQKFTAGGEFVTAFGTFGTESGQFQLDFHVADNNRRPAGQGTYDWRVVLQTLASIGYQGHLTAEFVLTLDRTHRPSGSRMR